ncbi:SMAD/FHA domain-containing protein [Gilbertella persicaria]|uniref:SMAD/FHA domain-containing protein n=1 Tax=Gilbertella persicaria TaxID=101096 RepID=UPI00221EFE15|nr:SMAD/FHA domain-containing protein [Gilbertella persicaria]KAI8075422.1 SMAD/FHA domain-containing protein [Gilbertella persicaria]
MSSPSRQSKTAYRSRSRSPPRRRSRSPSYQKRRSRSPPRRQRYNERSRSPPPRRHNDSSRGGRRFEWGRPEDNERAEEEPVEKVEPNFGLSGKLAAETNTVKGVELKYNEPPESAKPKHKWRLYVFKGDEQIDLLHIHRQSSYLIGRDRVVVDIAVDHPSCSKQHAVIQYREVAEQDEHGRSKRTVKPFIIDLEATNGTFLNGDQIPATRFVELRPKDVLKFGNSTREYVLLRSEQ